MKKKKGNVDVVSGSTQGLAQALAEHAGSLNALTHYTDPDFDKCRCPFADGVVDDRCTEMCCECGKKK